MKLTPVQSSTTPRGTGFPPVFYNFFLFPLFSVIILFLPQTAIAAENTHTLLQQAESLMDRAAAAHESDPDAARDLFAQAAARYDQLVNLQHPGTSPALYRAQGTAHHFAQSPGRAVLAFRRALDRDPTDRRTRHALAAARATTGLAVEPSATSTAWRSLLFWRGRLPRTALYALLLVGWFGFWIATIALTLKATPRSCQVQLAAATLGVAALAPLLAENIHRASHNPVVLIADAPAFAGPSADLYQSAFDRPLPAGTEATLIESRADFSRIALPDTRQGWVRTNTIEQVHTP